LAVADEAGLDLVDADCGDVDAGDQGVGGGRAVLAGGEEVFAEFLARVPDCVRAKLAVSRSARSLPSPGTQVGSAALSVEMFTKVPTPASLVAASTQTSQ
jgi:hypothetical protein